MTDRFVDIGVQMLHLMGQCHTLREQQQDGEQQMMEALQTLTSTAASAQNLAQASPTMSLASAG